MTFELPIQCKKKFRDSLDPRNVNALDLQTKGHTFTEIAERLRERAKEAETARIWGYRKGYYQVLPVSVAPDEKKSIDVECQYCQTKFSIHVTPRKVTRSFFRKSRIIFIVSFFILLVLTFVLLSYIGHIRETLNEPNLSGLIALFRFLYILIIVVASYYLIKLIILPLRWKVKIVSTDTNHPIIYKAYREGDFHLSVAGQWEPLGKTANVVKYLLPYEETRRVWGKLSHQD